MISELEEAAEVTHDIIKEDLIHHARDTDLTWIDKVALSTMIMALISALGALLAGVTSNQLLIERTESILKMTHMETDRINFEILKSKHDMYKVLSQPINPLEKETVRRYQDHFKKLNDEAKTDNSQAKLTFKNHELFALGVTFLSIAITLSGMSLVTHRKRFWFIGLSFGSVGTAIVTFGVWQMLMM